MRTNYVLIDFENVPQLKGLGLLAAEHFKVYVFVGKQPSKRALAAAASLPSVERIRMAGNGPNALDFPSPITLATLPLQIQLRVSTSSRRIPASIR